jgi:thiamine-monophosphate kinase
LITVGELGELALLDRLRPFLAGDGGDLVVGAGDDAAVWQPPLGSAVVVTTDSLVEGSHFRVPLDAGIAVDLGWRLLATSLSDIAAMGARPGPAFISLALPPGWPVAWVEAVYQGLAECAARSGVAIAGGNISASATAVLTSTCTGSVDSQEVLRRDGARAGWELAVTGTLGAAAAALRVQASGEEIDPTWREAARPQPRLEAGRALIAAGVRVGIDVSDGLFIDAGRLLAPAPAAGLLLDAALIPVAAGIRERWPRDWPAVAGGGEDYELLFAAPAPQMRGALTALADLGLPATVIGRFDATRGLRLLLAGAEIAAPATGHRHVAG